MNSLDEAINNLLAKKYHLEALLAQRTYECRELYDVLTLLMRAMESGRTHWTDGENHAFRAAQDVLRDVTDTVSH